MRCFMPAPALSRPLTAIALSIGVPRAAWSITCCRPTTSKVPECHLRYEWTRRCGCDRTLPGEATARPIAVEQADKQGAGGFEIFAESRWSGPASSTSQVSVIGEVFGFQALLKSG